MRNQDVVFEWCARRAPPPLPRLVALWRCGVPLGATAAAPLCTRTSAAPELTMLLRESREASVLSPWRRLPRMLPRMLPELLSTSATIFSIHEYLPSDNVIAVMMTQQGPCDS